MNNAEEIVMKKIEDVKPYDRNPRRHAKTVEKLVELIPTIGFNVPLVIDRNGVIVKGHARYKAAIKLGMTEVPCIVTNNSDEQNKLDRIADNRVSEFSQWLPENLEHELDMLRSDFSALEFSIDTHEMEEEADEIVQQFHENQISEERYRELIQMEEEAIAKRQEIQHSAIVAAENKVYHPETPKKVLLKCHCEKCGAVVYVQPNQFREYTL